MAGVKKEDLKVQVEENKILHISGGTASRGSAAASYGGSGCRRTPTLRRSGTRPRTGCSPSPCLSGDEAVLLEYKYEVKSHIR